MSTATQTAWNNADAATLAGNQLPEPVRRHIEDTVSTLLDSTLWARVQCITVEDAARCLSVYPDTVREWIKAGKLHASKVGREYIIRLIDLDRVLSTNALVVPMHDRRFKRNRVAS